MNNEYGLIRVFFLIVLSVFMGYLEASVAFYLRSALEISGGFIPIPQNSPEIYSVFTSVEKTRQVVFIVVMLIICYFTATRFFYKFLGFFLMIGFWHLSFLAFLKAMHGWPVSYLSYDILFSIPSTIVAPIIASVLVTGSMALTSLVLLFISRKRSLPNPETLDWGLGLVGAVILLMTFLWDGPYYEEGGRLPQFSWTFFWIGYAFTLLSGLSYATMLYRKTKLKFF